MNAIVCDKCGKVVLLENGERLKRSEGLFTLYDHKETSCIDLCEDCVGELRAACFDLKVNLNRDN